MNLFYEDDLLKVYHGDNRELLKTFPDNHFQLILADPPYGINYQPGHRGWNTNGKTFKKIEGDKEPPVGILSELYRVLKPDSAIYLFTRWDVLGLWKEELEKAGFDVRNELIWVKNNWGMGDLEGAWGNQHESILYASKGNHRFLNGRPASVINAKMEDVNQMTHPTQKPRAVWHKMIRHSSDFGDLVLDPFAGSCSSLLACRSMKRHAIGCEIDLEYLEAASPRLHQSELLRF
jgi:DNA modification methylase